MSRRFRNELDHRELGNLGLSPGLCADCAHLRLLRSSRSVFVLCARAESDAAFARYPALPVTECPGHARGSGAYPAQPALSE